MPYNVDKTAIVDEGATIGDGSHIWHFSHICKEAVLGTNCRVGQNVFIGNKVHIGDNVKIQNNVSIYDHVHLESDVFCGPSMVFTNVYNPRSAIPRKDEYRDTLVRQGATLGANCTIICGVTLGKYCFVGAGAVINRSVADYSLVLGVPGVHRGWMSEFGERLDLPLSGQAKTTCQHTGAIYQLDGNILTRTT